MQFVSTRSHSNGVGFAEALLYGLAPDGGLYQPEKIPDLFKFFLSLPSNISFNDLAIRLSSQILGPEIDEPTITNIVQNAFGFEPILHKLEDGITMLELFHGPSCAFKDFGAAFLASTMNHFLSKNNSRIIIITATSGDTGSAVAQAFYGRDQVDVVILYPSGRVSPLQEKQLTTLGNNILALEVDGSFDDCQRMAKSVFSNHALNMLPLSSANSINIGRLIPQIFYYVWAWLRMREQGDFTFVVPSGNFGNITAGLYAAAWGLPVSFVAATNANDVIPEYLHTGIYRPRPSLATISNAMDVGSPSNYERLEQLYSKDITLFRNNMDALSIDDTTTRKIIAQVYRKHGYLCCPHTAVGWGVAELYRKRHNGSSTVVLSTAHPGKFMEIVESATGVSPALPPHLSALTHKKKKAIPIGNVDSELANFLLDRFN